MTMQWTAEQESVLRSLSDNRITVVRAGPGSGKTRVFVEALAQRVGTWPTSQSGVAALSFTNAAHQEVARRLPDGIGSQHFLGTIDAFMLRFVIRPFGHLVGIAHHGCRVVPDVVAKAMKRTAMAYGPGNYQRASVFEMTIRGGTETGPDVQVLERHTWRSVAVAFRAATLAAKKAEWKLTGNLTHADCQFVASEILHGPHGQQVAAMLLRRFPVILIDEFQDTGWFLGRAVLKLLEKADKALVVGDPDQAIYQFAGADRSLFSQVESIEGAKSFLLSESKRCPKKVAEVATLLSRSGKVVAASPQAEDGQILLLRHSDDEPSLADAVMGVRKHLGDPSIGIMVLCRRERSQAVVGPWQGGSPNRLCMAVYALLVGDCRKAAQIARAELSRLVLDDAHPSDDEVEARGVLAKQWNRAAADMLLNISSYKPSETWNSWVLRVRTEVEAIAIKFSQQANNLGQKLRKESAGGEQPVQWQARAQAHVPDGVEVLTVHKAKGREADVVLLLMEKPPGKSRCPSETWWATGQGEEEMEVAYVACSRAKRVLCLVMHESTWKAMAAKRARFISMFKDIGLTSPGKNVAK